MQSYICVLGKVRLFHLKVYQPYMIITHTHTHTHIYIYVYVCVCVNAVTHRQTVSSYHTSSWYLELKGALSWAPNPPNFRQSDDIPQSQYATQRQHGNFTHIYQISFLYVLRYRLPKCAVP